MKHKISKTFSLLGVLMIGGALLQMGVTNSNIDEKIINKQTNIKEYNVGNYKELEEAMNDANYLASQSSQTVENAIQININLTGDIDLANFKGITWGKQIYKLNINGNGYRLYNKPNEYYLNPIFVDWKFFYNFKVENIVLDDAPVLFDLMMQTSDWEYINGGVIDEGEFMKNAIIFNNITIENSNFSNHKIDLAKESNFGLLGNQIWLFEHSIQYYDSVSLDNGIYFGNLLVRNNTFNNNNIVLPSTNINNSSISWISNLEYQGSNSTKDHHEGLVVIENISIYNNKFYDNTLEIIDKSNILISFGSVLGELAGLSNWKGSDGNYLIIKNISVQNNLYENIQIKDSNGSITNFYAELIGQIHDDSYKTQKTLIKEFEKVFVLNNLAYSNYDETDSTKDILISQSNITVVDMEDDGNNQWNENASKEMIFVGPNYSSSKNLNVMGYDSASLGEFNDVYHGAYLEKNSNTYTQVQNKAQGIFGIYGYLMLDDQINIDGQNKTILKQIILPWEDTLDLIQVNPIYDSETQLVKAVEVKFRFALSNTFSNTNGQISINKVSEPYNLSNFKLYQGDDVIASYNDASISASENYIYSVTFKIANLNQIDTNNLYLEFNYKSSNKIGNTFKSKINQNDLQQAFVPVPIKSSNLKIILIVCVSIGFIILLVLILVVFFLMKKYKTSKISNTQDDNFKQNYNYDDNYYENQDWYD